jgi:copper(I)-binding protein
MPNMPSMGTTGGQMTMQPVASMPLKAHTAVVFQPGGRHVMLIGLARPLQAGHHVLLTLGLRSGAKVEVDALVADNPPT